MFQLRDAPGGAVFVCLEGDDTARICLWSEEQGLTRLPGADLTLNKDQLSRAQALFCPARDGARIHAWYYPPSNPNQQLGHGEFPPMVVKAHGGPTAASGAGLQLDVQFGPAEVLRMWTSTTGAVRGAGTGLSPEPPGPLGQSSTSTTWSMWCSTWRRPVEQTQPSSFAGAARVAIRCCGSSPGTQRSGRAGLSLRHRQPLDPGGDHPQVRVSLHRRSARHGLEARNGTPAGGAIPTGTARPSSIDQSRRRWSCFKGRGQGGSPRSQSGNVRDPGKAGVPTGVHITQARGMASRCGHQGACLGDRVAILPGCDEG